MSRVAQLAVAAAVYAIDRPYSYRVPEDMPLAAGMRVLVPFGHGNRRTEGRVKLRHNSKIFVCYHCAI